MKKLALVLMILAVLTLGAAPALAADPGSGAFALASYFPDDIDVYFGVRADEQAIADVDGLLAKLSSFAHEFGATDVPSSMRDILLQMSGITPDDIDAVLAWAGDYLAYGMTDTQETAMIVLPLDDRAAAEEFIISRTGDAFTITDTQGTFTVYEGSGSYLLFSDEVLLAANAAAPDLLALLTSGDYPRLSDREGFAEAVSSLPDENYMLGLYAREDVSRELNMGLNGISGSAAAGISVLNGTTLAVDIFSPMTAVFEGDTIDPAFMRHIPVDSNMFIHGSNLGGLIDAGLDPAARQQAAQVFTSAGLDLDSVLEWMSGDFAVYSRLDFASVWQPIMTGIPEGMTQEDLVNAIDIGLAIEATDAEAAAQLAQAILLQMRAMPVQAPGSFAETQEIIGGTDVTVLSITPADGSGITIRLAIAANEEVYLTGTYNGVASILGGQGAVDENALVAEASVYFLPDAHAVWFVDGEMLGGVASVGALVLLGPAVQNIFDNIADSLNGTGASAVAPTPAPDPMADLDFDRLMDRLTRFLRHMTASTRIIENGALFRVTLTLGQ